MANVTASATAGWREQDLVDLDRRDLLAAAVDLLLQPTGEEEVALVVEHALVAGAEPAGGERGLVGRRVVLVAVDDGRAPDRHLAALTGRQHVVRGVEDRHLDAGGDADRARLGRRRRQRVARHLVRGLGHPVGLDDRHAEQLAAGPRAPARAARPTTSGRSAGVVGRGSGAIGPAPSGASSARRV